MPLGFQKSNNSLIETPIVSAMTFKLQAVGLTFPVSILAIWDNVIPL